MGAQYKSVDDVATELDLPVNQVLALFNKLMRKVSKHLRGLKEEEVAAMLPDGGAAAAKSRAFDISDNTLEDDLSAGARITAALQRAASSDSSRSAGAAEVNADLRAKQARLLGASELSQCVRVPHTPHSGRRLRGG